MDPNTEPIEPAEEEMNSSGGEEQEEDWIHVTPVRFKRNCIRPKYLKDYVDL